MTRFSGPVGYGKQTKIRPGVYEDVITERLYFGTVTRTSRELRATPDSTNGDISVQNSISIVADAFARDNFIYIRYVMWRGVRWTVREVTEAHPRLLLQLGEVYNGPIPA